MMRYAPFLLFACLSPEAFSQPGTLDATFGDGGVVQIDLMPDADAAQDVLPMNDGRLYVTGYLDNGSPIRIQ